MKVKPTKEQLNRIYYLQREIDFLEEDLAAQEITIKAQAVSAGPIARTKEAGDPTGQAALSRIRIREQIEGLKAQCEKEKEELMEYIIRIDDSLLRQIVRYRCIMLLKWDEVAARIGGGNTAENVRQIYHRTFKE